MLKRITIETHKESTNALTGIMTLACNLTGDGTIHASLEGSVEPLILGKLWRAGMAAIKGGTVTPGEDKPLGKKCKIQLPPKSDNVKELERIFRDIVVSFQRIPMPVNVALRVVAERVKEPPKMPEAPAFVPPPSAHLPGPVAEEPVIPGASKVPGQGAPRMQKARVRE